MSGPASIRPSGDRGTPTSWSKWTAASWPSGWTVLHVDETGSTNDDLLSAAVAGKVAPRTALVAAHQTAGRGRLDRRWDAPPGSNLLVTLFAGPQPAKTPSMLMQRVGLAAVEGIESLADSSVPTLGLKWPNDVMLGERKLAGVLAQARTAADELVMVVGIGMNVAWAPDGAANVRDDIPGASEVVRGEVLAAILTSFDGLANDVGERYRQRLVTLGRRVRVELPGGRACVGQATAVGHDGRIEVTDDAGVAHRFDVGDVIHLRPDPG